MVTITNKLVWNSIEEVNLGFEFCLYNLLRNDDSHGYDIPEFEEMYELFTQNEEIFVSIRNACTN